MAVEAILDMLETAIDESLPDCPERDLFSQKLYTTKKAARNLDEVVDTWEALNGLKIPKKPKPAKAKKKPRPPRKLSWAKCPMCTDDHMQWVQTLQHMRHVHKINSATGFKEAFPTYFATIPRGDTPSFPTETVSVEAFKKRLASLPRD